MERKINVVQEGRFEVHVVLKEGVNGEVEAYWFKLFSAINKIYNYLTYN